MALSDSEIARVKYELGYGLLGTGAEPYFDHLFAFTIIQQNLNGGALTTSSTAVTAASAAAPVAITLADPTGFAAYDRVVVDVDDRQEVATISNLSGSVATLQLRNAHSGTYPVTVEGPETIVREILTRIRETKAKLAETQGTGSLKAVDEVEFHAAGNSTSFGILGNQLAWWREQLAAALGFDSNWSRKNQASQVLSVY